MLTSGKETWRIEVGKNCSTADLRAGDALLVRNWGGKKKKEKEGEERNNYDPHLHISRYSGKKRRRKEKNGKRRVSLTSAKVK